MAEPEVMALEPGQRCYEYWAGREPADCAWPLWGTLTWWEREAWRKQEEAEKWREQAAPLEGGTHEASE